jgi:hypothetical protein
LKTAKLFYLKDVLIQPASENAISSRAGSINPLSADLPLHLGYNRSVATAVGLLGTQRRLPIETDSDYFAVCTICGQRQVACQARERA